MFQKDTKFTAKGFVLHHRVMSTVRRLVAEFHGCCSYFYGNNNNNNNINNNDIFCYLLFLLFYFFYHYLIFFNLNFFEI